MTDMSFMSSMQLATCWKNSDPCSKGLQCKIITDAAGIDRSGMSLQVPVYENTNLGGDGYSFNSFRRIRPVRATRAGFGARGRRGYADPGWWCIFSRLLLWLITLSVCLSSSQAQGQRNCNFIMLRMV